MLTGYHPFAEKTKFAVLLRIFKTLGTPSDNFLNFPTFFSSQDAQSDYLVKIISAMPQWQPMELNELIQDAY